jgi:hypothetical protein
VLLRAGLVGLVTFGGLRVTMRLMTPDHVWLAAILGPARWRRVRRAVRAAPVVLILSVALIAMSLLP